MKTQDATPAPKVGSSAVVLRRLVTTAIRDAGVWEANADDRWRKCEPGSRAEGYEQGYATAMNKMKFYLRREFERLAQNKELSR